MAGVEMKSAEKDKEVIIKRLQIKGLEFLFYF
jgi:hypothetical protein